MWVERGKLSVRARILGVLGAGKVWVERKKTAKIVETTQTGFGTLRGLSFGPGIVITILEHCSRRIWVVAGGPAERSVPTSSTRWNQSILEAEWRWG